MCCCLTNRVESELSGRRIRRRHWKMNTEREGGTKRNRKWRCEECVRIRREVRWRRRRIRFKLNEKKSLRVSLVRFSVVLFPIQSADTPSSSETEQSELELKCLDCGPLDVFIQLLFHLLYTSNERRVPFLHSSRLINCVLLFEWTNGHLDWIYCVADLFLSLALLGNQRETC